MALSENAELEELIRKATGESAGQTQTAISSVVASEQDELDGGLDLGTLVLVARRSLIWVILLLTLGFTGSWLFLRYTKPIYKAASLIKLDERSEAANIGLAAAKGEDSNNQLAGEVELIKSNLTYRHLKERLALDVNYYAKGTVLEAELYDTAPFHIQYTITNPELYNRKFQVNFPTATTYQLNVKTNNQVLNGTYKLDQWIDFPGARLMLSVIPGRTIPSSNDSQYHFVILDDAAVSTYLNKNLDVAVVNPSANTIQISFTDNNPQKAAHIINNIDTVYLQEKIARKKQTTAQSLEFIDQVIADNDKRW